ncbi:1,4-alpha-glucan branching enzyme GlgB [Neolewinella maritima]|uniref:1,4-alpha-glucan branching enzyme GlgB n=1 Tax=Neolewinella maritima TaxID=1383882 RepID=A0ABM9AXH6_9BACT|nr:alpha-amylase family glycosyl hydrolase [Neolewinella maritima]CAH0999417.1 1,4-alpha-glucan branching enzyme GlgB [Neolewinella maritima]
MTHYYLLFFLLLGSSLSAQLITSDPAAPVADKSLTITYDASLGTAGLKDCDCDVYLHTGLITPASADGGDWQNIQTTWGVANDEWKLTPVAGEPNKYTYTFSPTVREYFDADENTVIEQVALVFRNADGTQEGKAAGGANIFVDISSGDSLSLTLTGQPGTQTYALGKVLPVTAGTTSEATISIFDNDSLVATGTGQELNHALRLVTPGAHTVRVTATADGLEASDSFSVTGELMVDLLQPDASVIRATVGDQVTVQATSYITADLQLSAGTTVLQTTRDSTLTQLLTLPVGEVVTYTVTATYRGETASRTVTYITGAPSIAALPAGAGPGATRMDNGDLMLVLRAPGKSDVFVVGNFNDWAPVADSRMNRTPDDSTFWIQLPAASLPDSTFLYQYAVDDQGRFADPYSTLVLDPFDDRFIGPETFAGIPDYPTETEGIVSWLRLQAPEFVWRNDAFELPDPEKMVVYELLIRDFLADHSFASLTDTLDYLDRLGINTIELMPVSEFEGNISWGYNPSFHMALDKYYGSPEDLKAFVDAAHARDIAVVLDVVYNHAFGQSPLVQLWPGAESFVPGPDNPYANVTARHLYNVGTDLNHESALTKEYVKTTAAYWLREFHVDGFRWDLTKGFTQKVTTTDEAFSSYDASRIAILKDYADLVWSVNDSAYMIMEHLAESREEEELAQYGNGMYFWSGFDPHNAYLQASMGYDNDNLAPALAANRGFSDRSLIAYMESHDEERMMFKNLSFGNSAGSYDVTDLSTALDRVELSSALFYSLPGPKMLWQFGELGYDYSINFCGGDRIDESCRTDPKPIGWSYRSQADRRDVYNTIADLLYLRNNYDFFHGDITGSQLGTGAIKYVHLSSSDGAAAVFGNFDVSAQTITNAVPSAGMWYDYFSGDSTMISDPAAGIELAPGEYRVYLSQRIEPMGGRLMTSLNDRNVARLSFAVYPNPTSGQLTTTFTLERSAEVTLTLLDLLGRPVQQVFRGSLGAGSQTVPGQVGGLPTGTYFLRLTDGTASAIRRVVIR